MMLATTVRRHPAENDTSAGEKLAWLTQYAVLGQGGDPFSRADDQVEIRRRDPAIQERVGDISALTLKFRPADR